MSLIEENTITKDNYTRWKELFINSRESIEVFTPLVSTSLLDLLSNSEVSNDVNISIYTDVSDKGILKYPNLVNTMIQIAEFDNVSIYSINGINVNILITDSVNLISGSQDFEFDFRESLKTSFELKRLAEDDDLLTLCERWADSAKLIDKASLIDLEQCINSCIKEIFSLRNRINNCIGHHVNYKTLFDYDLEEKIESIKPSIENLYTTSKYKYFGRGYIILRQKYIEYTDWNSWADGIDTFMVDQGKNLIRWKNQRDFDRLRYYPVFNFESKTLAYARLAKTRISFFSTGINFNRSFYINNTRYYIVIRCPQDNLLDGNLEIEFLHGEWKKKVATMRYLFTGSEFLYVKGDYQSRYHKQNLITHFVHDENKFDEFVSQYFDGANLSTCAKRITNYMEYSNYKIRLISYGDTPILVVSEYH